MIETLICPSCKKDLHMGEKECHECKVSGVKKCPNCHGKGRVHRPGTGGGPTLNYADSIECSKCKGEGFEGGRNKQTAKE